MFATVSAVKWARNLDRRCHQELELREYGGVKFRRGWRNSNMCGALVESRTQGGTQQHEAAWYCIRSQNKREHFAAAHLRQISGLEVFNPQLRMVRSTRRGPVRSTESLFPNYLFARFCLETLLEKVRYTPSVKEVVQFGERIPPVSDFVIDDLRQSLREDGPVAFTDQPQAGEETEVLAGPFEGEKGVVAKVLPAKQRVQVLLHMMDRSVSAEFSLGSILFKRRNAADFILGETAALSSAGMVKHILTVERCRTLGASIFNTGAVGSQHSKLGEQTL